ncbi:MAG: hypothetical protein UW97_C0008G0017 [Parcubacteria group bacterium GW2011_GWA2_45_15]|nr:MAG: hypothetical protein UW97_C0008G0017 [Parcubacteria group bacterium GW2011_GWA2_45_15]
MPPFCLTLLFNLATINKMIKKVVANMLILMVYLTISLPLTIIDRSVLS